MTNTSYTSRSRQKHRLTDIEIKAPLKGPSSDVLAVWMHPYKGNRATQEVMLAYLREAMPGADLLMPRYPGGLRNTDPFWVAAELQYVIARAYEDARENNRPYQQIVLIGYSAGALLIRKALAYGLGELEDHPFPELGRATRASWEEIATRTRVVLLAGINRGWSLEEHPVEIHWFSYWLARLGLPFLRLLPIGRFAFSLERGSPFVANLRIQWIRLSNAGKTPPVVQLLGGQDSVVRQEDNKDALVSKNFVFIPVPFANHRTIVDFEDPVDGPARKSAYFESLTGDIADLSDKYRPDTEALKADDIKGLGEDAPKDDDSSSYERPSDSGPGILIFLIHGIRDNADWPRELARKIRSDAQMENPPIRVRCVTSSYGHFPMLHFLLFKRRKKNVRWFMDRYTEELAKLPDAKIHYVGHSNGTYLLAEGLRTYTAMRFDRVAFMGSVVPGNFPWRKYYKEGRIREFRNDRSAKDWIVGVFPGFYQLMGKFIRTPYFSDIGDGGFRGFDQSVGDSHTENYYFNGGHGKPTEPQNHPSLATYILSGKADADPELLTKPSPLCVYLSRLNWLVWLLLIAVIGGIGAAIFISAPWGWTVVYILSLLLIMSTV